jgi:hypothetical protein
MMDFICATCGAKRLDILMDTDDIEPQRCCEAVMRRFWSRPPKLDARSFYDPQAGRSFASYHEAERWAKRNGKALFGPNESIRSKTREEKIAEARPKRQEAVRKSYYRLKHGYKDHPELPTEKELRDTA